MLSFVLPRFDQYWEGQLTYELAYIGGAVLGYGIGFSDSASLKIVVTKSNDQRIGQFGFQMTIVVGEISAYHRFLLCSEGQVNSRRISFFKKERNSWGSSH